MVNYWYFVRDIGSASTDSVIYQVKVGRSEREQIKFDLVRQYCRDCGLYFRKVSDTSDRAIRNLEKRLFPGTRFLISPLRRATVSISELYSLIIHDSFASYEDNLCENKATFIIKNLISPSFYAKNHQKKIIPSLPTHPRKYLKWRHEDDYYSFLIGSAMVVISFLVAAFLEGKFVYGF